MALGGRESDIVPLSKFRQGSDIRLTESILFVTYATLRSAEREGERAAQTLASKLDTVGIECPCLVPKLGDINEDQLSIGKDALRVTLLSAMKMEGLSD